MTRPITAGIDGTEESLAALAWAAREAVRRDLPLRVVHAWRFEAHDAVDTRRQALNYAFAVKAGLGVEMSVGKRLLVAFERLPHEVVQAAREWALEQANA